MGHQIDYCAALALVRKVASKHQASQQVGDIQGLISLIKDLPDSIKLLEDGFLPLLSTEDLDDVSLMDDIMDLGRNASTMLKDLAREGFDMDGADFNDKLLRAKYEQIDGLHKSAAEVSDSQLSAAKALAPTISALRVLSRNYDRGVRKLESSIGAATAGTEEEAQARGALGYFYHSYDRMLRGPLGLQKVLSSVAAHVRRHEQAASSHAGVQQLQELRVSVSKTFDKVRAALGEYPDKITDVLEIKDGVWARTVALLSPMGLSTTGKYAPVGSPVTKAAAASEALLSILPKVEAFQEEMMQVLSSARDALRQAAPRSSDIVKRMPGLYMRVLGDLSSSVDGKHESSNFQKEDGADVQLAATMESLLGEEKRLQKMFTTFQARAEKFGQSEVKNLASKSSRWRKDLESRLAEHGLRPNGTVTSDLIGKLAFVDDSDQDALAAGVKNHVGLGADLQGILSDLSAYWKGYVTLLRSGHEDSKKVADGFREAVSGTEDNCLGRHVHRYAQYLKGLVESGAKPTLSGSLPGAAMHMTGVVSSRVIASLKAAPPAVETIMGNPEDRRARQDKMLSKIMDNEVRDALEEVDSAAMSLPADLKTPLDDKPELNLLDRFLEDNGQLISRIVDVALASGYRGDHTNGKNVLLKEIGTLKDSLDPEAFSEYRKKAEEEASSAIAKQEVKMQGILDATLQDLHSAFSNLVSGGNSMESGVPQQGDTPSSDDIRAILSGLDAELEARLHSRDFSGVYGQDEAPRASDIASLSKTLKDIESMYSGSKLKGGATVAKLPNLYALLTKVFEESGAGTYRLSLFKGIEAAPISKIDRKTPKVDQPVESIEDRKDLFKKMQTVFGHLSSGDLSLSSRVPKALEIKSALRGLGAAMLSATNDSIMDLQGSTTDQMKVVDERSSRALDELRSLYAGGRAHSEEDTRLKVSKIAELLEGLVYKQEGSSYQLLSFPAVVAQPSRQEEPVQQGTTEGDTAEGSTLGSEAQEAVTEAISEAEKATESEGTAAEGRQVFTQAIDVTRKRMRAVQDAMSRNRDRAVAKRYQMQLDGLSEQVANYRDGVDKYNEVLAKITELTETMSTLQETVNSQDTSNLPSLLEEVKGLSKTVSNLAKSVPNDPIKEVAEAQAELSPESGPGDKKTVQESARMLARLAKQLGRISSSIDGESNTTLAGKLLALQRMTEGAAGTLSRYSTLPWEWSIAEADKGEKAIRSLEASSDEDIQSVATEALQVLFSTSAEGAMKLRMYPLVVTSGASHLETILKGLSSGSSEKLVAPIHGKSKNEPATVEWTGLSRLRSEIKAGPEAAGNLAYLQGPVAATLEEWLSSPGHDGQEKGEVAALLSAIKAADEEPLQGSHLSSLIRLPEKALSGKVGMGDLLAELSASPTKSGSKHIGIGKYLKTPTKMFPQKAPVPAQGKPSGKPSVTTPEDHDSDSINRSKQMIGTIRDSLDSKDRGTLGRFIRSEEIESPGKGESLRELVLNFLGVVESSPAAYEDSLSKVLELVSDKQYEAIADEIERRPDLRKFASTAPSSIDLTVKLSWHFFGSGTASPVTSTVIGGGIEDFKRRARREGSDEFLLLDKAFTTMLKSALAKGPVPFLNRSATTHPALFGMLKAYRTQNNLSKPEFLLNVLDISSKPSSQLRRLDGKEDWEGSAPRSTKDKPQSDSSSQLDLFP